MTFWQALRESILEMVFGSIQLDAWRAEKAQREECERVVEAHRKFIADVQVYLNTEHPNCPPGLQAIDNRSDNSI